MRVYALASGMVRETMLQTLHQSTLKYLAAATHRTYLQSAGSPRTPRSFWIVLGTMYLYH